MLRTIEVLFKWVVPIALSMYFSAHLIHLDRSSRHGSVDQRIAPVPDSGSTADMSSGGEADQRTLPSPLQVIVEEVLKTTPPSQQLPKAVYHRLSVRVDRKYGLLFAVLGTTDQTDRSSIRDLLIAREAVADSVRGYLLRQTPVDELALQSAGELWLGSADAKVEAALDPLYKGLYRKEIEDPIDCEVLNETLVRLKADGNDLDRETLTSLVRDAAHATSSEDFFGRVSKFLTPEQFDRLMDSLRESAIADQMLAMRLRAYGDSKKLLTGAGM